MLHSQLGFSWQEAPLYVTLCGCMRELVWLSRWDFVSESRNEHVVPWLFHFNLSYVCVVCFHLFIFSGLLFGAKWRGSKSMVGFLPVTQPTQVRSQAPPYGPLSTDPRVGSKYFQVWLFTIKRKKIHFLISLLSQQKRILLKLFFQY